MEAGGVGGQNVSEDPQKIQRTSFRYILLPLLPQKDIHKMHTVGRYTVGCKTLFFYLFFYLQKNKTKQTKNRMLGPQKSVSINFSSLFTNHNSLNCTKCVLRRAKFPLMFCQNNTSISKQVHTTVLSDDINQTVTVAACFLCLPLPSAVATVARADLRRDDRRLPNSGNSSIAPGIEAEKERTNNGS